MVWSNKAYLGQRSITFSIKPMCLYKPFLSCDSICGWNDASSCSDIKYFKEHYEQVIQYFKKENSDCHICLCSIRPRIETDTLEVNEVIYRLCQHPNIGMIDLNQAYYDKRGSVMETYFVRDPIHLSASGVKRLLGVIDKEITVVEKYDTCVVKTRQQNKGYMQNKRLQVKSPRHQWI